jgi:DNA polymerase III delta prime subunit
MEIAVRTLATEAGPSEVAAKVTGHLRCEQSDIVPVTERFPTWEHVNLQRGVEAYLAAHGSDGTWFGVSGAMRRPHEDLMTLITTDGPALMPLRVAAGGFGAAAAGQGRLAAASFGTAPVGPDENTEVVLLGMIATAAPGGAPVVIGIRSTAALGPPFCFLDVLAANQEAAIAARNEIDRLTRLHDAFRGQVLSFSQSEHHGNELVSFLPRPAVAARDVVLPDGVLETIELHVAGIADWSHELLAAGQHLKRGLLLHGPPGTGKTHTVRYLTGRLTSSTVILLTGTSIRFIDRAAALARRLQPSIVVLEDVDLVGMDRDFSEGSNPLLFSLLEAMDGVGADADVTFVLTTNRADILEMALADRPGRIDLAVEIPRPDAACRERLLRLYAGDLAVDVDLAEVAAGTDGVTASFVKELIRRVVLASLRAGDSPPVLRSGYFTDVLAGMNSEHHALTRSLLGGEQTGAAAAAPPGAPRPPSAVQGPTVPGSARFVRRQHWPPGG